MKKQIISGLLAACMAVSCLAVPASNLSDKLITSDVVASAATEYTSGDYKYTVSNKKATITAYTGSATKLTIPSKLGGYKVTKIGDYAFSGISSLKKVVIPNTVTKIGDFAFDTCESLKSYTVPKSVKSIGVCAIGTLDNISRIESVRIKCYKGTEAEAYAKKYGLAYTLLDGEVSDVETPSIKGDYNTSTSSVRIKWSKVEDASGYRIYQYNSTTKTWDKIGVVRDGSTTNYKVTGLSPAKTYKFKVQAYKKSGSKIYSSSKSKTFGATTKSKAVTNIKASKTKTTVTLKWDKVKCSGYEIEQYNSKTKNWDFITMLDSSTTSYTIESLSKGTSYKFRIASYYIPYTNTITNVTYVKNEFDITIPPYTTSKMYSYSATKKVTTKS